VINSAHIPADLQHALVNHLWQSTSIMLLIWLLTIHLKKYRANLRYRLWMLASVKFLVPLSFLVEFGKLLRSSVKHTSSIPIPQMSDVIVRSIQPYAALLQVDPTAAVANAHSIQAAGAVWIVCLCVWGFGTVVMAALWLRTWLRLYNIARLGTPWGKVSDTQVLLCEGSVDPGVFGILKPVILLPEALPRQLSQPELDTIYAHELCHARRRDNLTAAFHAVVHSVFWFHPAVWIIRAKLMDERERACDETVLASGVDIDIYARSIVRVCKLQVEGQGDVMAWVTGGNLKERIQRILSNISSETLSPGRKCFLAAAAILVVMLPISLGVMNTQEANAQTDVSFRANSSSFQGEMSDARQQATETLKFDVASVRPSKETDSSSTVPLGPGAVYPQSDGILRAKNFSLLTYLVFAYKLADYHMDALDSAAFNSILHDRYSIEARTEKPNVTKDELRLMMQTLLTERFKLAVHYEKKQVRVFALTELKAGSLGPKLRLHPVGATCIGANLRSTAAEGKSIELPLQSQKGDFPSVCNGILGLSASAQDRYSFGAANVPMPLIASSLSSWGNLGRPVVDQTGLTGTYDFVMDYTPDPRPSYATVDSDGPGFREALKEQLGLKLEDGRAPVDFLVLDHVEHPNAN
jgi:bla regulator protein BlaR1